MSYPKNNDPFAPWNNPMHRNDPFAAHNDPMHKDDPFKPWNEPFGNSDQLNERERQSYRLPTKNNNGWEDDY